jgi:CRISPR/Cas system-associated exonuclease Cas4 (RecB family)
MTPTPRLITISAWSYSRLSTYTQCPRKAKYLYVDKLKEPDDRAPALVNGSRVHALAAVHTTRKLPKWDKDSLPFKAELERALNSKRIPSELECFKEEFGVMIRARALVEQEWAFSKEWNYLGPDGWFSKQAWLRVKVDAHFLDERKKGTLRETTVHIVDHKTGKFSPDHALQRSLYALAALIVYPDATAVAAAHWYLDAGREEKEMWRADQLPALKEEWIRRTTAMLSDTTFAPNPTDKCRWCHFRKDNGGPCSY